MARTGPIKVDVLNLGIVKDMVAELNAERALADDLAADLIKTRARLGRGQESKALARWREARPR